MRLTPDDQLFFCETCEGYAVIRNENKRLTVTPCQCQFEEENN